MQQALHGAAGKVAEVPAVIVGQAHRHDVEVLEDIQGWPGGHAQLEGAGICRALGHDDALQVDDEGRAARELFDPADQPLPPRPPGQLAGQVAAKERVAGEEEPLDPGNGKMVGAIDLDQIAGGGIKRLGRIFLGVAGSHHRPPGLMHLLLEPELEVLSAPGIQMLRLGETDHRVGVSGAQDPQGFLIMLPGLRPGQVMGKVRALEQEGVGGQERGQGLGQTIPLGGLAVAVDGQGHDPGPGKVMGDKRQERPDAVFVGKEIGRRHQGVFPEAGDGGGIDGDLAHDRLKVSDGYRERRWAPSKVVGAEDNDPPVILPGGQGEGLGDEVRGQQVVRHGKTGEALGQGGALGLANGAEEGLRLGIKGRKGSRRRRGVLAAAAHKKTQEEAECGEAAHLGDH